MSIRLLRDVQLFSEVVLLLHDVGEALVRDVEEIDEGLDIAGFEQMRAYAFSIVILVQVGDGAGCVLVGFGGFVALSPREGFVGFGVLVGEDGGALQLGGLLDGLDLLVLLLGLRIGAKVPSASATISSIQN